MSNNIKQEKIKKRIALIEEIKTLDEEIKKLQDDIEGLKKQADQSWRLYKTFDHKKHFISAQRKYEECHKRENTLCELKKEKEYLKNKLAKLKTEHFQNQDQINQLKKAG